MCFNVQKSSNEKLVIELNVLKCQLEHSSKFFDPPQVWAYPNGDSYKCNYRGFSKSKCSSGVEQRLRHGKFRHLTPSCTHANCSVGTTFDAAQRSTLDLRQLGLRHGRSACSTDYGHCKSCHHYGDSVV